MKLTDVACRSARTSSLAGFGSSISLVELPLAFFGHI
jgi:hypothetical protein